jgi:uncharacterized Zn-binding protein involved in type VI secretion
MSVCRVGDLGEGICTGSSSSPHTITGTIINGAATVFAEGSQVSRLGDIVEGDDGHQEKAIILSGSPTVYCEGGSVARIGDFFEGKDFHGILISGAATVYAT